MFRSIKLKIRTCYNYERICVINISRLKNISKILAKLAYCTIVSYIK